MILSLLSISACNDATDGYDAGCTACDGSKCTACDTGYTLATNELSCHGKHFLLAKLALEFIGIGQCFCANNVAK